MVNLQSFLDDGQTSATIPVLLGDSASFNFKVAYAYPKTRPSCEGHATLLLSYMIRPVLDDKRLGLPQDIHVVHHVGAIKHILLPVLCVADSDNILPLLTSTLYQRHILGMMNLVIGFMVSPLGSTAQLILGWLEENSDKQIPVSFSMPFLVTCCFQCELARCASCPLLSRVNFHRRNIQPILI